MCIRQKFLRLNLIDGDCYRVRVELKQCWG